MFFIQLIVGFIMGIICIFYTSQIFIPLFYCIPKSLYFVLKGELRPSAILFWFWAPLIWLAVPFLVGFFFPSIAETSLFRFLDNPISGIVSNIMIAGLILSTIFTSKGRADAKDDFWNSMNKYRTSRSTDKVDSENFSYLRYTISGWLMILSKLSAFILIPILAYKFNNWWLLFGIAFVYIGQAFGWKRPTIKIIIIAIVGVLLSVYDLFNQLTSCYFLCFAVGFIIINLYRVIGLGDKTTRALIATTNSDVRQEILDEVRPQIDEAMNELRNKKNSNRDTTDNPESVKYIPEETPAVTVSRKLELLRKVYNNPEMTEAEMLENIERAKQYRDSKT